MWKRLAFTLLFSLLFYALAVVLKPLIGTPILLHWYEAQLAQGVSPSDPAMVEEAYGVGVLIETVCILVGIAGGLLGLFVPLPGRRQRAAATAAAASVNRQQAVVIWAGFVIMSSLVIRLMWPPAANSRALEREYTLGPEITFWGTPTELLCTIALPLILVLTIVLAVCLRTRAATAPPRGSNAAAAR